MQTEEKVRNIEARLSSKIVKTLKIGNWCFARSAFTATKLIKFRPYKITVVHELSCSKRLDDFRGLINPQNRGTS
jgi:hypothetical protein